MSSGSLNTTARQELISVARIAVASETTTIGSLGHYVAYLDAALRSCAGPHQTIVSPKLIAPTVQPVQTAPASKPGQLRLMLREIAFLRDGVRWVRRHAHPRWPEARSWARKWRSMPRDVIALLPHVVIADEGELNSYYAAIAERRLVWVIHDLHGYHFPDQWRKEHLALMRRRFRLLSKRVTWVIVHNEFTADDVVEKLAISREKISIVGLPALISREEHASTIEPDTEVLARHRITQPYALWASSSTFSHKNHERLLEAWSILSDRGHGLQLVCTGARGPRWEQVSARIASLRLEDSVCFTDNISDADMAAILRNAHLAVCPTLFEGGGPVPAAEAVMASIPVAASDIPQVRQLFDDREDLISFFDPMRPEAIAAAVEQIVVDYETVKRRADFARSEYGRMRTWEKTAKAYWNAIERAVSAEA